MDDSFRSGSPGDLVVLTTHPVQYHAPVYRFLRERRGVSIKVIYASDFSVVGYRDKEFGTSFAWDTPLADPEYSIFLSRVADGGAASFEEISARGLRQAIAQTQPNAFLLTGYSPAYHRSAFLQAWLRRRPLLFRAETTDHARMRSSWKAKVRAMGLRFLYGQCDYLLPIGQRSIQHYRALGCAEEKLILAPYCVDTAPFRCDPAHRAPDHAATRQSLGISPEDLVLIFSGKLSQRKGPHLLLDAIAQLRQQGGATLQVIFLGDGGDKEQLAVQAERLGLRAYFTGFQNQGNLSRFYNAADALVLPSTYSETWGLVVNEALHHGLPAIVSDAVGCADDLVLPGLTGEVAAANSVSSLASALARATPLMRDPETALRTRERIAKYTVEQAALGIERAYLATQRPLTSPSSRMSSTRSAP